MITNLKNLAGQTRENVSRASIARSAHEVANAVMRPWAMFYYAQIGAVCDVAHDNSSLALRLRAYAERLDNKFSLSHRAFDRSNDDGTMVATRFLRHNY